MKSRARGRDKSTQSSNNNKSSLLCNESSSSSSALEVPGAIAPTELTVPNPSGSRGKIRRKRPKNNHRAKSGGLCSLRQLILAFVLFWIVLVVVVLIRILNPSSNHPQDNNDQDKRGEALANEAAVGAVENVIDGQKNPQKELPSSPQVEPQNHGMDIAAGAATPRHHAPARVESSSHLVQYESPLLIFTCKRANYLKETLTLVMKYLPRDCEIGCPIIISQDGTNQEVVDVVQSFQEEYQDSVPIFHVQHPQSPLKKIWWAGYEALAKHYGWGLKQTFSGSVYQNKNAVMGSWSEHLFPDPLRVIILEEDLRIAPDFFSYFKGTALLLDTDETLLAVSAFNDNGKTGMVEDERRLLRSDFFPGLGWMMRRDLWVEELSVKWPKNFWDDWLREPDQRKGRHIIRPEVPRTFHFGFKGGASGNQYGGDLIEIQLNDEPIDFEKEDLQYLFEEEFNHDYIELLENAELIASDAGFVERAKETCETMDGRIEYKNLQQFERLSKAFNLMSDEKAGVPRTAYKGVVETRPSGEHILFLTPPLDTVKEDLLRTQR